MELENNTVLTDVESLIVVFLKFSYIFRFILYYVTY